MSSYIQLASVRGTPNRPNYIQLANIIGHSNLKNIEMVKDDFYTLCMKNPEENRGLRLNSRKHELLVFNSNEINLDYLCSDFVRFCLSFYKNNSYVSKSEVSLIPKQSFPISEELKEYIKKFLPDFYGIRK